MKLELVLSVPLLLIVLFLLEACAVFGHGGGGSVVRVLPGFDGPLPFYLETGYLGVDQDENVQLFYYFVKSTRPQPEKDPLLFWLTGGPGCSSLSAFLYQFGPLSFYFSNGTIRGFPRLGLNPYSWTQEANILFLDSPVGTGFSYGKTEQATYTTNAQSCQQAYAFLQKWLRDHAEFISSPFYVGGDSFSGTTVPLVARIIADGIDLGSTPRINLRGYLLGNPITSKEGDNYRIPFAYGMGIIPPDLYQSLELYCKGNYRRDVANDLCSSYLGTVQELMQRLDTNNVLEPKCPVPSRRRYLGFQPYVEEQLEEEEAALQIRCRDDYKKLSEIWANDPRVRESLHIQEGSRETWIRCNEHINSTAEIPNVIPYHKNLTSRGYRSLIYSGHLDAVVPTLSTMAWIDSLKSEVTDKWRPWFVDGQVGGYTRSFENQMTYATVWGAGHIAQEYRPKECFAMFKRWISHNPL